MLGAIIGDIVGSPYESDLTNIKTKDFKLFDYEHSHFTDDTIMTIAVAKGLIECLEENSISEQQVKFNVEKWMVLLGNKYPYAGYGNAFREWLVSNNRRPYNSYGNGSAMRTSSVGWLFNNIEDVNKVAEWVASITHNHPEGIKGAQAISSAIFLARINKSKKEIKEYIEEKYNYDLNFTLDNIRGWYYKDLSCQGSVPQAVVSFLESTSFEDCIRNAISIGGDSDTIAAMAGSIAEAYYGLTNGTTFDNIVYEASWFFNGDSIRYFFIDIVEYIYGKDYAYQLI